MTNFISGTEYPILFLLFKEKRYAQLLIENQLKNHCDLILYLIYFNKS